MFLPLHTTKGLKLFTLVDDCAAGVNMAARLD